jgi:hypothetical protein
MFHLQLGVGPLTEFAATTRRLSTQSPGDRKMDGTRRKPP